MSLTAKHFLDIYRVRKSCQDKGVTNPPESIKEFTAKLVKELESLSADEIIQIRKSAEGLNQFVVVSSGKVLAELPKT